MMASKNVKPGIKFPKAAASVGVLYLIPVKATACTKQILHFSSQVKFSPNLITIKQRRKLVEYPNRPRRKNLHNIGKVIGTILLLKEKKKVRLF